jgi:hypothetical protein
MRNDAARSSETLGAALTKAINGITDENALIPILCEVAYNREIAFMVRL